MAIKRIYVRLLILGMALSSTTVATSLLELFRESLEDETNNVLCIGFNESQTSALIDVLGEKNDPPKVNFLTRESVLKWVRDDFVLASKAADLVATGALSVRTIDDPFRDSLLVSDSAVMSFVTAGELTAGHVTGDEGFVEAATEKWLTRWKNGEEFSLRTPEYSRVETSLGEAFDAECARDFRRMLNTMESTRGDGFDVVEVSLLVTAKHEELLYDISMWGETVGVASKATFSREKTNLEERGIIETEKVPIDVGRPRLRLVLPDDLQETSAEELPAMAREFASSTSSV